MKRKKYLVWLDFILLAGTDPAVYEVGRRALDLGVLPARNMTREALMSKLMLLLPVSAPSDLERRLGANLCDDVLQYRRAACGGKQAALKRLTEMSRTSG